MGEAIHRGNGAQVQCGRGVREWAQHASTKTNSQLKECAPLTSLI